MTGFVAALLAACVIPLQAQRVILVSFDGLGAQTLFEDPAAELSELKESVRRGASSPGVQTAFPSTTANSHAAIWTGCYGDINYITANNPPALPRAGHTFAERVNGFRAEQLNAEAIWVTAAKAGVRAVAHQPTQGYPFTRFNAAPSAVVMNGYQTKLVAPHALWTPANGRRQGDGSYLFQHGPATFRVRRIQGGVEVAEQAGGAAVRVPALPAENEPPRERPLARRFSEGLFVAAPAPAVLYFRLFTQSEGDFRLYVTAWQELACSEPVGAIFQQAGGFLGNGPSALLTSGKLTEEEYLEAVELVTRQMVRHAEWLDRKFQPRLLQSYLPFPDEFDHEWLPASREGSARHQAWRRWGFMAINRAAAEYRRLAGKEDYLLWVSDHGMAAVDHAVAVGRILKDAGLEGKANYLYNSILVNTAEWRGGTVSGEERRQVLEQARSALAAVPAFTRFYAPEDSGSRFGIGGPAGGDLYFDLAPGYAASSRGDGEVIVSTKARGVHGFSPERADMKSICIVEGPQIAAGTQLNGMRAIDIAPLVAQLLGIEPPPTAQGRAPLGVRSRR
ncbi:MAG: alkaline phosphatase family protein [Acidobacteria bacterium]|nr:alkaline phosphatase family protein [Acidobacteriota bacterium]